MSNFQKTHCSWIQNEIKWEAKKKSLKNMKVKTRIHQEIHSIEFSFKWSDTLGFMLIKENSLDELKSIFLLLQHVH